MIKDIVILKRTGENWYLDFTKANVKKLAEQCYDEFVKNPQAIEVELEFKISSVFQYKSSSQLGYLHAAIFPAFYQFMIDNGIEQTWEDTRTSIKLHPEVDFTEEKFNPLTNKHFSIPRSLAKATKVEATEFIDKVLRLASRWGLNIESPEEYKKRHGIKTFTK